MFTKILSLALLAAFATAQGTDLDIQAPQSALLHEGTNYSGTFVSVAIDGSCVDLSTLSPNLSGKVKSIYSTFSVNCRLYSEADCSGYSFEAKEGGVAEIPGPYTTKSVKCTKSAQ